MPTISMFSRPSIRPHRTSEASSTLGSRFFDSLRAVGHDGVITLADAIRLRNELNGYRQAIKKPGEEAAGPALTFRIMHGVKVIKSDLRHVGQLRALARAQTTNAGSGLRCTDFYALGMQVAMQLAAQEVAPEATAELIARVNQKDEPERRQFMKSAQGQKFERKFIRLSNLVERQPRATPGLQRTLNPPSEGCEWGRSLRALQLMKLC